MAHYGKEAGENILRNLKAKFPELAKHFNDVEILGEYSIWMDSDEEFYEFMMEEIGPDNSEGLI